MTTPTDKLVERLRLYYARKGGGLECREAMHEAADALEAKDAEIAQLRGALELGKSPEITMAMLAAGLAAYHDWRPDAARSRTPQRGSKRARCRVWQTDAFKRCTTYSALGSCVGRLQSWRRSRSMMCFRTSLTFRSSGRLWA